MIRIQINLIPLILIIYLCPAITRMNSAADVGDKVVFQFPEYDYKETSKNVSLWLRRLSIFRMEYTNE